MVLTVTKVVDSRVIYMIGSFLSIKVKLALRFYWSPIFYLDLVFSLVKIAFRFSCDD